MDHIIDTQCFLWFIEGNPKLSERAKLLIQDVNNINYISIASIWEMSIKIGLGKLTMAKPFTADFIHGLITEYNLAIRYITVDDTIRAHSLPMYPDHKDPFDRLIIAQCLESDLPVISCDALFDRYAGVTRLF